jgi:uncharacterized protein (TIGR02588 family)
MSNVRHRSQQRNQHWIEWITGVASSVVVFVILSWVGYEAITQETAPPQLFVQLETNSEKETGHEVRFSVANRSDRTAASVIVRGEVIDAGAVLESAEMVLEYVPAHSQTRGAFIFRNDTKNREVRILPRAYTEP